MASARPRISRVGGHAAGVVLTGPGALPPLGPLSHKSSLLCVKTLTAGKKMLSESALKDP